MAGLEVSSKTHICFKCGEAFGRKKGYFHVSYGILYKGNGYLPYCMKCVDSMYNAYVQESQSAKDAVRQICRKLDLYWNQAMFDSVEKTSTTRSMMTGYLSKVNGVKYAGKSYDDTLRESGTLWDSDVVIIPELPDVSDEEPEELIEVAPEVIEFWGAGFSPDFYVELDRRYKVWADGGVTLDKGTVAIYKQICILEETINRDSAAGKPIDKHVNSLNSMLGSAHLKPMQKKKDEASSGFDHTPFGVWIRRWEDTQPVPEPDPEFQEGDKIIKYVLTWFSGHIGKMLGIKNLRSKLYDDELERYRVEMPEYEGDDDETMLNNIFGGDSS